MSTRKPSRVQKKRRSHTNNNLYRLMMIITLCAALVIANILYVMVAKKHIWSQHDALASSIRSSIVSAPINGVRGTIYDRNHTVLAEEAPAYTLIATFDRRTDEEIAQDEASIERQRNALLEAAKDNGTYEQTLAKLETQDAQTISPYVEDPAAMASAIQSVLGDTVDAETITSIIEEAQKAGKSQTELGTGTKRIDKSSKEALEALKIPGLSFIETTKRTYPVTPLSSNLIGFAAYDEDEQNIKGVMGLESDLNEALAGTDGKKTWQQTINGTILPGTTQTLAEAVNGHDVTLTLDASLQETVEQQMQITMDSNNADAAWCLVMEAETGKILAWASYPTFDQNTHMYIPSYIDNISQRPYEPGSVLKPFVYAAAMDAGVYPYNTQYRAGEFVYAVDENGKITRLANGSSSDYPVIRDALGTDYGVLTFEEGLAHSSNVGICELLSNYLDHDTFEKYLKSFGFGENTDSEYVSQVPGSINMEDAPSYLSSGFGQSTSVNVLELAQAYTAIFNDGVMMRPYVVESISDPATGEIIEKYGPESVGTPISSSTAEKVKNILVSVLSEGMSGERFAMNGVSMAAKTGTGEIYRPETGSYDGTVYTSSIMAAAPAEDPKIMVYWGMESPNYLEYSPEPFQKIMQAALIADNVSGGGSSTSQSEDYEKWESYEMPSLVNHSLSYAQKKMEDKKVNTVVIGDGTSIVDQFPKAGTTINSNSNVLLYTDGSALTMPDLIGWTLKDLTAFWQLTGLPLQWDGNGKVTWQSVEPGTPLQSDTQIEVKLEDSNQVQEQQSEDPEDPEQPAE